MAGGSKSGLNGMPRDPRQDARTRRALARLSGTALEVPPSGIIINSKGQLDILIDPVNGGGLQNMPTGLGLVITSAALFALLQAGRDITLADTGTKVKVNAVEVPAGIMAPFSGTASPATGEWLPCDGASYSVAAYPDLFAAIGYNYGGSGSHFNVPLEQSAFLGNSFTVAPNGHYAIGAGAVPDPDFTAYGFFQTFSSLNVGLTTTTPRTSPPGLNAPLSLIHTVKTNADVAFSTSNYCNLVGICRTDPATHEWHGGDLIGMFQQVRHEAPTALDSIGGYETQAYNIGSGTVQAVYSTFAICQNVGSGTITTGYGFYTFVYQSGTGAITTAYGIYVDYSGGTGHTDVYGYFCADQSQTPSSSQNWNYYSEDVTGTSKNYFGGVVSIGTLSPNASAKVQIDSTTQGFLPPRMTTTQINAISSPAEGLIVYDLTLHVPKVYNGTAWKTFTIT